MDYVSNEPLQVTVGCTQGISLVRLAQAIQSSYRTPDGRAVTVQIAPPDTAALTPNFILIEPIGETPK